MSYKIEMEETPESYWETSFSYKENQLVVKPSKTKKHPVSFIFKTNGEIKGEVRLTLSEMESLKIHLEEMFDEIEGQD